MELRRRSKSVMIWLTPECWLCLYNQLSQSVSVFVANLECVCGTRSFFMFLSSYCSVLQHSNGAVRSTERNVVASVASDHKRSRRVFEASNEELESPSSDAEVCCSFYVHVSRNNHRFTI